MSPAYAAAMRWLMGGQVYDVDAGTFWAADIGIDHGRIACSAPVRAATPGGRWTTR